MNFVKKILFFFLHKLGRLIFQLHCLTFVILAPFLADYNDLFFVRLQAVRWPIVESCLVGIYIKSFYSYNNQPTLYVPVTGLGHVIKCLSFVDVYHICFSFFVLYINRVVNSLISGLFINYSATLILLTVKCCTVTNICLLLFHYSLVESFLIGYMPYFLYFDICQRKIQNKFQPFKIYKHNHNVVFNLILLSSTFCFSHPSS